MSIVTIIGWVIGTVVVGGVWLFALCLALMLCGLDRY
jgi:hypothetical protein